MIKKRCEWVNNQSKEYINYHDTEWGVPNHDDKVHFEFLVLEGAQAGLSWETILNKRKGYWKAYSEFDVCKVSQFDEEKIQTLIRNSEIVRNQLKIRSSIINARNFISIQNEFGSFDKYIWSFVSGKSIVNHWVNQNECPATSKESDELSKDLKKRGFKFVGSTIMYAYMQACGLVNDHLVSCYRHSEV